jgi:hypothetical protein
MRDLIVLLPGITGSVLQKDGHDIWALSGSALWNALTSLGDSLQSLRLPKHEPAQVVSTRPNLRPFATANSPKSNGGVSAIWAAANGLVSAVAQRS